MAVARRETQFLFIHVMKTGGASLRQRLRQNFGRDEFYPDTAKDTDILAANRDLSYMSNLPAERTDAIRIYTGHFPFMARELFRKTPITFTMLRHPVDRTISFLKQCQREEEELPKRSLEEIYEDPYLHPMLIRNHQAKVFSLEEADSANNILAVIDVDDRRFGLACQNLERVDAFGLQDASQEFHEELTRRFGWAFGSGSDRRVSDDQTAVAKSFRRRIADENSMDMAFYEHAVELWRQRQNDRSASRI